MVSQLLDNSSSFSDVINILKLFFFIGFFLFPQAPILVTDLLSLVLLVPLMVLVSGLIPAMFKRPLIMLGVAFSPINEVKLPKCGYLAFDVE